MAASPIGAGLCTYVPTSGGFRAPAGVAGGELRHRLPMLDARKARTSLAFSLPRHVGMELGERLLAAGDLDGDGDDEPVIVRDRELRIGLNLGGGRFDLHHQSELIPSAATVRQALVADLDGDGARDVVLTAPSFSENLMVFWGRGDGTLEEVTVLSVSGVGPRFVVAADFDGDRVRDLAFAKERPDEIRVLLSRGRSFEPVADPAAAHGGASLAAELDGDGRTDLVVRTRDEIVTLLGRGDGTFLEAHRLPLQERIALLVSADVNRDWIPDLVGAPFSGDWLAVFLGRGDGSFEEAADLEIRLASGSGQRAPALFAFDVSRDRVRDLVLYRGDWVYVFVANGDGTFSRPRPFRLPGESVLVAEIDGDRFPDLLEVRTGAVLLGEGDGGFRGMQQIPTNRKRPSDVAVADVNLDGMLDVLASSEGSNVVLVFRGIDGKRFSPPTEYNVQPGPSLGAGPIVLLVEDFDGDGAPDAAVLNNVDNVAVLLGRGDSSLTFSRPRFIRVGNRPRAMAAGDFDGDGAPDLVVANPEEIVLLHGRGDGTFFLSRVDCAGCDLEEIEAADLNGDGLSDLAVADAASAHVKIFLGSPARDVLPNGVVIDGRPPLEARDIDGSGTADLLYRAPSGELSLAAGVGDGSFGPPDTWELPRGRASFRLTVGDFQGDGALDVVTTAGNVSFLSGRGDGRFDEALDLGASPDVVRLLGADLDADGDDDLVATTFPGSNLAVIWNDSRVTNDCDGNEVPDACDVMDPRHDRDHDGVPDSCQSGGRQFPGDCNQDGRLEISDAICLVGTLFLGEPSSFPCGDGRSGHPANIRLLDVHRDGVVNLSDPIGLISFLFLSGPPHWLLGPEGDFTSCLPIEGCAENSACR